MNIYADTMPIHIYFKVPTSFKIKFVWESFVTLVTQISLASMNPHVVYMTGISLESLVTLAALISVSGHCPPRKPRKGDLIHSYKMAGGQIIPIGFESIHIQDSKTTFGIFAPPGEKNRVRLLSRMPDFCGSFVQFFLHNSVSN